MNTQGMGMGFPLPSRSPEEDFLHQAENPVRPYQPSGNPHELR